jgi:ApaG protein
MPARPFYHRESEGIRITVRPLFVPEQSDRVHRRYVFAYFVRLENVAKIPAQLLTRRWLIHDDAGEETEVIGDGVVGLQPTLKAGGVHEYNSFCFVRPDGTTFDAQIPRFPLTIAIDAGPVH